jgi:hypothetical protein
MINTNFEKANKIKKSSAETRLCDGDLDTVQPKYV